MKNTFYDISVKKIDGTKINLSEYRGKLLMIVNVASQCGLTPQYEALEKVYEKYRSRGFEILGFPANEFEGQEPGSNPEILEFCTSKFGVKFPMFEKIVVKGEGQHPLYQFLTETKPDAQMLEGKNYEKALEGYGIFRADKKDILWNFEKFLIGKDGSVLVRYSPDIPPDHAVILKAIEDGLKD